jgi:hypothetical protein
MPYIRTLNAKTITDEISIFIGASLLINCFNVNFV